MRFKVLFPFLESFFRNDPLREKKSNACFGRNVICNYSMKVALNHRVKLVITLYVLKICRNSFSLPLKQHSKKHVGSSLVHSFHSLMSLCSSGRPRITTRTTPQLYWKSGSPTCRNITITSSGGRWTSLRELRSFLTCWVFFFFFLQSCSLLVGLSRSGCVSRCISVKKKKEVSWLPLFLFCQDRNPRFRPSVTLLVMSWIYQLGVTEWVSKRVRDCTLSDRSRSLALTLFFLIRRTVKLY